MIDDLAGAWQAISSRLSGMGVAVFPSELSAPNFEWPNDDWGAFLDVVERTGTRLVYATTTTIAAADLDALAAHEATDAALLEHVAAARAAGDAPARIELGFAYGGVTHQWVVEQPWLAELDDAGLGLTPEDFADETRYLEELDERLVGGEDAADADRAERADWRLATTEYDQDRRAERERLEPTVQAWVAQLSEHPDYLAAPNYAVRRATASEIIPELDLWTGYRRHGQLPEAVEGGRLEAAYAVIQQADQQQSVVKERRIDAAKAAAEEWGAELAADPAFQELRTVEERRRHATEFVTGRLGFPSASVRDRVLSKARR